MSSTGTAPFAGVTIAIANNLDVAVDIYDVFDPATSGQTIPYLYTKLGTIGAGSSGTVKTIRLVSLIEAMYTGPVKDLQNSYYYQFPIKLMSGTQFNSDSAPPLSYTIAEADRQAMVQSFLFHKFAMANPDSALTKSLNDALKNKTAATFFAGTQNFKACTLGSWNAVMTWLDMFTSGWQGPYYLYEAAPASPPAGYAPTLIATLNIVSSPSANAATLNLCTQRADGSLQSSNPAQGSTLVMVGDGTMADSNPGEDVTASLRPVWMNVIQTTSVDGKPQTSYIAGPTMTGTIAGTKVVSTQKLIPLASQKGGSGSGTSSDSGSLFSSKNFSTLCQVVGLIVGVAMLYEMVQKKVSGNENKNEESKSDSSDQSDLNSRTQTNDDETSEDMQGEYDRQASTVEADSSGVADGYREISTSQRESVMTDTIQAERQSLNDAINEDMEEGETPSDAFETAVGDTLTKFDTAEQQIDAGDLDAASATMSDASTSMQRTITQSQAEMQQSEVDALNSSVEAVNDATSSAEALNNAQETYDNETNSAENDSGAPTEDETPETEEIPEEIA